MMRQIENNSFASYRLCGKILNHEGAKAQWAET